MGKILSIVIPYYTEQPRDTLPLLSSLNNQLGVDFGGIECVLVNDGNHNILPEAFLSLFFNLDIRVLYMEENRGPGVARQAGLDNAGGDYVMFCDADDVIQNVAVLGMFLQDIEQYHPDIITSPWLEETPDPHTNQFLYTNHEDENTWMHGKVFRRQFLRDKNIRFHDELRIHEDSYFLALARASTENVRNLPDVTYVWKWSGDSITRRDGGLYSFASIPEFIRAITLALARIETVAPEQMRYKVVQLIVYQYFTVHQPEWLAPERAAYRADAENAFRDMIKPYIGYFIDAPMNFFNEVYIAERAIHSKGMETELFSDWLNRVLEEPDANAAAG